MSKRTLAFSVAFVLCLLINLVKHNPLFIGILNSLVLILSIIYFEKFSQKKVEANPIFIILLSFIPLFSFNPQSIYIIFLQLTLLLVLIVAVKLPKLKNPLLIISLIILTGGLFVANNINSENLIFNTNVYQESFKFFRDDAMYIPYKLRLLVYNQSIYLYTILANAFKLLSLQNLYSILLVANIYPLIYSFYSIFKSKDFKKYLFFFIGIVLTFLTAGISKSPDKFNSLYFASPLFLFFILHSLNKINLKIYSFLLLISLFLL